MSTKTATKPGGLSLLDLGPVRYKYIPRSVHGVHDKAHPLFDGKLDGSIDQLSVMRTITGQFALRLTEDEEEFIRKGLGLNEGDLNPNNRDNKYLEGLQIELPKYGLNLDTNDPFDLLRDKVLLGYDNYIAPSIELKDTKATYRFVRIAGNEEVKMINDRSDIRKEAYKLLGQLEESRERMVMYILNSGARVHHQIGNEELKRLVNDTVESSYGKFISTLSDPLFNERGMINMAVVMGIIEIRSNMYYYEDVPMAFKGEVATLDNAALFIKDKTNGDIRLAVSKKTLDKFNNK